MLPFLSLCLNALVEGQQVRKGVQRRRAQVQVLGLKLRGLDGPHRQAAGAGGHGVSQVSAGGQLLL